MNQYIEIQIRNMIQSVELFQKACTLAASKDDGRIDREEAAQIRKIEAASERFLKELGKIK